ncbi:hypothetical protein LTR66_012007 [Elasticomyces elasticus]|nr:hypothetical protein LTR66_012007 [Elasticomyces elasticus]KAK4977323.1 hypothetical protein LTR28_007545 [Elasticomyces elasticus]
MPFFPPSEQSSAGESMAHFVPFASALPNAYFQVDEERAARVLVKNRRKRYLDTHPEYFESADRELEDPIIYDELIRRFLTPAERELDRRRKGYSGVLESDILRSEAKLDAVNNPDPNSPLTYHRAADGSISAVGEDDDEDVPKTKEEGEQKWREWLEMKFVRGEDAQFDYSEVDWNPAYNDLELERRREEEWFGQEEEAWDAEGEKTGETGVQDF